MNVSDAQRLKALEARAESARPVLALTRCCNSMTSDSVKSIAPSKWHNDTSYLSVTVH